MDVADIETHPEFVHHFCQANPDWKDRLRNETRRIHYDYDSDILSLKFGNPGFVFMTYMDSDDSEFEWGVEDGSLHIAAIHIMPFRKEFAPRHPKLQAAYNALCRESGEGDWDIHLPPQSVADGRSPAASFADALVESAKDPVPGPAGQQPSQKASGFITESNVHYMTSQELAACTRKANPDWLNRIRKEKIRILYDYESDLFSLKFGDSPGFGYLLPPDAASRHIALQIEYGSNRITGLDVMFFRQRFLPCHSELKAAFDSLFRKHGSGDLSLDLRPSRRSQAAGDERAAVVGLLPKIAHDIILA